MKKVLAIVLTLVMVFSFASVASAFDVAPGQVYLGLGDNIYANPGDTIQIPVEFKADAFESDGFDKDGELTIDIVIATGDGVLSPFNGWTLTEEALAVGAKFEEYEVNNEIVIGLITMPASLLYGGDFTVMTIEVPISEEWQVVDYVAVQDLNATVASAIAYVVSDDGSIQDVTNFVNSDVIILAAPYAPTTWEKLVEKLKGYVAAFLNIVIIGIQYLLSNVFNPAPWA